MTKDVYSLRLPKHRLLRELNFFSIGPQELWTLLEVPIITEK